MKKQLLFVLLMFLPIVACAEEVEIDGLWYNLVSKAKVAEVIQYKNNQEPYTGDIVIPEVVTYEGVEYSVTSIGESAFSFCYNMTSLTIGRSIKTIKGDAFMLCDFKSVHISDLTSWCNIVFSGYYSNPLVQAHHLYIQEEEIKELVIPSNVTNINDYAFCECSGLTSISIPNSVTNIGNSAFAYCTNLSSVTIPNSVTTIGNSSFRDCTSLTSFNIPNTVTSIGSSAFYGCSGLTSISIPNSVTTIAKETFALCTSLTSITIPNSVKSIGESAFGGCSGLTSIIIPNSIIGIGNYVFRNCSGLTSVTIPNSVTSIGEQAFSGCSGLTSVTIPNSVTSIGKQAFSDCSGVTSITIGNSVNRISSCAFANCQELTDVFCYAETVPSTETDAFDSSYPEYATLHVPEVAYESYKNTAPWSNFGTIKVIDGETPIVEKCATPTITYANGKVRFACETEGVEFVPSIMVTPNQLQNGNELAIGGTFTVSVYAVKEGYDNSDTATMTINMSQMGDVNADGELNSADITAVVNAILGK